MNRVNCEKSYLVRASVGVATELSLELLLLMLIMSVCLLPAQMVRVFLNFVSLYNHHYHHYHCS